MEEDHDGHHIRLSQLARTVILSFGFIMYFSLYVSET
jgi:hypothetical protein